LAKYFYEELPEVTEQTFTTTLLRADSGKASNSRRNRIVGAKLNLRNQSLSCITIYTWIGAARFALGIALFGFLERPGFEIAIIPRRDLINKDSVLHF